MKPIYDGRELPSYRLFEGRTKYHGCRSQRDRELDWALRVVMGPDGGQAIADAWAEEPTEPGLNRKQAHRWGCTYIDIVNTYLCLPEDQELPEQRERRPYLSSVPQAKESAKAEPAPEPKAEPAKPEPPKLDDATARFSMMELD